MRLSASQEPEVEVDKHHNGELERRFLRGIDLRNILGRARVVSSNSWTSTPVDELRTKECIIVRSYDHDVPNRA